MKDYFRGETADRLFKELGVEGFNASQHAQHVESVENALDVPERNVGKWEIIDEVEPRRYGCSNCKRMVWNTENFCPNCGAKMEG